MSAQNFVDNQTAATIVKDMFDNTEAELDTLVNAITYTQKKYNLKAYQIFQTHVGPIHDVENSVMMAVMEVKPLQITEEDYNNNALEPELLRIKNHLIQILTQ